MRWLVALVCLVGVERAFGRAGTGDGSSKYKNTKSLDGFCTDTNKDEEYYKEGYCQSLAEQFNKNECMKKTVENIRKGMTDGIKGKDGKAKFIRLPFSCSAKPPAKGDLEDLAKNNASGFSYILMQYVAMLTAQQSGWDVLKDESNGGKGPGGLLNLSLEKDGDRDMENGKYACGCKEKVITTSGGSDVGTGQYTVEGQSPGPLDGHHSMTCGAFMIYQSIEEDGGSGEEKDENKPNGPMKKRGITRILPDVESEAGEDKKKQASAKWRDEKMETFCTQFFKKGTTNTWDGPLLEDIGGEQLKGPPAKSSTSQ